MSIADSQSLSIAVRAYVCKAEQKLQSLSTKEQGKKKRKLSIPSEWAIVFDTETTIDAAQKLRFGTYQVRKSCELMEKGIFYEPATLTKAEQIILRDYADTNQLVLRTAQEFIENIFYDIGYKYRASIIGFNLPFDISRLAIDHAPARTTGWNKIMRGGFTFKLSENFFHPRVQIKHISSRDSFIQFAATIGQRTSKGNAKKDAFSQ